MDIRVTNYNNTTTTTMSTHGRVSQYSVQNAATSGPVSAVPPTRATQGQSASPTLDRVADGGNGGYTDSIRGSLVNILA